MKRQFILCILFVIYLSLTMTSLSTAQSGEDLSGYVSAQEFLTPEENLFFDSRHTSVYVTDPDEMNTLLKYFEPDNIFASFLERENVTIYPETITPIYELDYYEESNSISLQPSWGGQFSLLQKDARGFVVKSSNGANQVFESFGFVATEEQAVRVPFVRPFSLDDQNKTFAYQSFDYADNARRIMTLLGRDTFVDPKNVKAVLFRYIDDVLPMFYIKDDLDECFIEAGFYDENVTASWDKKDYVYTVEDVVRAVREARKMLDLLPFTYDPRDMYFGIYPNNPALEGHSVGIDNPAELTADNILNTWEYLNQGMVKPDPSPENSQSTDESEESNDHLAISSESTIESTENDDSSVSPFKIWIILGISVALLVVAVVIVLLLHRKKSTIHD